MRKTRITPIGANTFAIHVDSYQNGVLKGQFNNAMMPAPREFSSLVELVLEIDEILDRQAEEPELPPRPASTLFVANLELEIMFRQNHSWQGRLTWPEANREATFRSVLELLVIVDTIFGS